MARRYRPRKYKKKPSTIDDHLFMLVCGGLVAVGLYTLIRIGGGNAARVLWYLVVLLAFLGTLLSAWRLFRERYSIYALQRKFSRKYADIRDHQDVLAMTPRQFEEFVSNLYHKRGYEARPTQYQKDEGVDIYMDKGAGRVAVQTKLYRPDNKVRAKEIRDFRGSYVKTANHGIFVTTSSFTPAASSWAKRHDVELVDGDRLAGMIERAER